MDNLKNIITGGVITLLVGGTAYTFSQQDLVNNFSADTGLTQEQAEQYIDNIPEDELVPFEEVGFNYVSTSKETLALASEIDCVNYEYEWESATLTCAQGKAQMQKIANSELAAGNALIQLNSDSATEADIRAAIGYIDQLNSDYELDIAEAIFDSASMEEIKLTNSYNKSILKSALETE